MTKRNSVPMEKKTTKSHSTYRGLNVGKILSFHEERTARNRAEDGTHSSATFLHFPQTDLSSVDVEIRCYRGGRCKSIITYTPSKSV